MKSESSREVIRPPLHIIWNHQNRLCTDMLTVLVLVTLLMVSVESDSSSTEEWKSLSNPKSRTLFFQMLQSYLDGREAQGGSRRMNMKEDRNSKMVNAAFDRYSNFLHNSILDI
ncbi:hypothetical protein SRHO_G00062590 [Serrasalmus rhombeus]